MEQSRALDQCSRIGDAELDAIRNEWIAVGLCTAPADRPRAEAAVRLIYRQAGLSDGIRCVWTTSPVSGAITANALMQRARRARRPANVASPTAVLCPEAVGFINPQDLTTIRRAIVDPLATRVTRNAWRPILQQVTKTCTPPYVAPAYGQHDALAFALADVLRVLGLDVSGMEARAEVARSSGWWWPFDDVCVLSERPSLIALDECGRLHSTSGAAVRYPDGWSIYAHHGDVLDPEHPAATREPQRPTRSFRDSIAPTGLHLRTQVGGTPASAGQSTPIEQEWIAAILGG